MMKNAIVFASIFLASMAFAAPTAAQVSKVPPPVVGGIGAKKILIYNLAAAAVENGDAPTEGVCWYIISKMVEPAFEKYFVQDLPRILLLLSQPSGESDKEVEDAKAIKQVYTVLFE